MPIFILMAVGYFIKKIKLTDKKGFDVMNKVNFKLFLPLLLFNNIYSTKTAEIFDIKLVIFTIAAVFVVFLLGYPAVLLLTKENKKRGVILQGFFRANYAILGIPLVSYICGDKTSGIASLMVAVVIPVFNVLAVVALERFREGNTRLDIVKLVRGIITNPLIIASILGVTVFLTGIKFPALIEKSIKDIASVSTPLAIIVLGATFEFSDIKGSLRENLITVVARLIVVPLLVIPTAVLLGFTGEPLAVLLVVFGAPVAVSSLAMAQEMDGDETLAAQSITTSTAFCLVTLFLWIFVLSYFGLF